MFIIVVGQGKVGTTLSSQLCAEGHDIVIIDKEADADGCRLPFAQEPGSDRRG